MSEHTPETQKAKAIRRAAPELLEACIRARGNIREEHGHAGPNEPGACDDYDVIMPLLDTAIAKALSVEQTARTLCVVAARRTKQELRTMGSVPEELYRELNPDGHWFDDDTLHFFGTEISIHEFAPNGDCLFITSEQPPHGLRGYAVRRMNHETGNITGRVCEFATHEEAVAALEKRSLS